MAIIPELSLPTFEVAVSMIAKAPIRATIHVTALLTESGSSPDRTAMAPTSTPMVTDSINTVLEASLEYPLAPTMSANMRSSFSIAVDAVSRPSGSNVDSSDMANDMARIAPDIRMMDAPALTAFFPAKFVAAMIIANIAISWVTADMPRSITP